MQLIPNYMSQKIKCYSSLNCVYAVEMFKYLLFQIKLFSFHTKYNLYVNPSERDWYFETLLIHSLKDEPSGSWDALRITLSP